MNSWDQTNQEGAGDCAITSHAQKDLAEYEKYWEKQLPGSPAKGIIVVVVTLFISACIMSFPWVMAFLQDEGIIRPTIHLRGLPEPVSASQREEAKQEEANRQEEERRREEENRREETTRREEANRENTEPGPYGAFGKPRD